MIGPALRLLERDAIATLLGIRFWDAATDAQVRDGLRVTARLDGVPGRSVDGFRTASDAYAFQGLPRMYGLEHPGAPGAFAHSPPTRRFVVAVDDADHRYVPVAFTVDVPLPYRGVLRVSPADSPALNDPPGFYLFSSVARPTPPGLAALRADLIDAATSRPAAHAMMEVRTAEGTRWYGIADSRGGLAVPLPYPPVVIPLDVSPPVPTALADQRWPLAIRVRYAPGHLTYPVGSALPDLRSIFAQPHGVLQEGHGGGASAERLVELVFGEPLLLRSEPRAELLVGAAP